MDCLQAETRDECLSDYYFLSPFLLFTLVLILILFLVKGGIARDRETLSAADVEVLMYTNNASNDLSRLVGQPSNVERKNFTCYFLVVYYFKITWRLSDKPSFEKFGPYLPR